MITQDLPIYHRRAPRGPLQFVIYVNNLPECVEENTYLFVDDTNIFREGKTEEDRTYLQDDLDKVT